MTRFSIAFAGVMLANAAISQDLPPEVLLLSRVKNHLVEDLHRLTTLSCLETVQRKAKTARGKLEPLDTVRLEVLTNGDRELFASPGDRKFSERHPLTYAGVGMLSDGLFGPYLKDIFLNGTASSTYKGEEDSGGRRLARYDYRLPVLFSGQTIEIPEGSGCVGLRGSFWVDPKTYDVVHLELEAYDFPPSLPVSEAKMSVDYERTRLAENSTVLLPTTAEVILVKTSGEISRNRIEFTHCRVFGAESTLRFDSPDSAEPVPSFGVASIDDTLRPLDAGLKIRVTLRSRISDDMVVGTLISGVVANDVLVQRAVVVPAGSPVRGRIRRLEHYTEPESYFVIGLEFTEVEIEGIRHLFYADLVDIGPAHGVEFKLSKTRQTERNGFDGMKTTLSRENIFFYNLPGVATFIFKGATLNLPPSFSTEWKTRALTPEGNSR